MRSKKTKLPPGERLFQRLSPGHHNVLVPWYLMASYLYYHRDESLLRDETYDRLCKRLDAEWDSITHPHRDVVRRVELRAGSCFLKIEDFPMVARSAACGIMGLREPW